MKKLFTFTILGGLLIVLLTSITEIPPLGEEKNPAYNEVSEYYVNESAQDTGAQNIIAAIITDYRAFDTLGETTVLFTGIAAVTAMIGVPHDKGKKEDQEHHG
ncbi:hydrogen gas-evolving membrane-bound hydrogenase subunit E [Proteiniclasticum ruminis]|uniref:Multicomponent Na+:H+ antiporter subunit B n=1 Tax=Proteiniclasticum ruminis TaxID=398199 RepID=A0A1G8N1E7_9CLOT|nr:hydrogen gas-evolving membrane-bound hydrogenase subunit E [Proteiniclasticum ruminis]SDI74081.1 multicomponent Na+:H+ antiporter subunit B [Proteiniclasticum ruminis]